jgi:hypothetical protein
MKKKFNTIFKNIKKHLKENPHYIVLAIIFFIAIFFRFIDTPYRYTLADESIRDAIVGIVGAETVQFPLTGPFSSAGPFTFGPWYWYQLIFANLLIPSLYASWIYLGIISVIAVVIYYLLGTQLVNKIFGTILAGIVAFSPLQINSSYNLTNPNVTHIFIAGTLLLFFLTISKTRSYWYALWFGILFGVAVNLHYSAAGLGLLLIFLLLYKPKQYIHFIVSCVGIFITFVPLLLFDLNNHWFTLRNMYDSFIVREGKPEIPYSWTLYLRDFWPEFWSQIIGTPYIVSVIFLVILPVIGIFTLIKYTNKFYFLMLGIVFLLNFVFIRYYSGEKFIGYLNHFQPFVFLFVAIFLYSIYRYVGKVLGVVVIIGFVLLVAPKSWSMAQNLDVHMASAETTIAQMKKVHPGSKFSIYTCYDSYRSKAYSVMFLLYKQNLLSDSGIKYGLIDGDCSFPNNVDTEIEQLSMKEMSAVRQTYPELTDTGFFNFTSESNQDLVAAGWDTITPKSIHKSSTRWWFDEQP